MKHVDLSCGETILMHACRITLIRIDQQTGSVCLQIDGHEPAEAAADRDAQADALLAPDILPLSTAVSTPTETTDRKAA